MTWVPGQPTVYHPEGAVIQHPAGSYYIRENGNWRLMTEEEVQAWLAAQSQAVASRS